MQPETAPPPTTRPTAPTALLLDFDGTLAPVDITARLHHDLGRPGWQAALELGVNQGEGSLALQRRLLAFLPQDIEGLLAWALRHDLDPAGRPLIDAARRAGWAVEVASDGYGFYIPALLARHGIEAATRCADVAMAEDGLRLLAPWAQPADPRCPDCTTCKLAAVADHRRAGRRVVLVGDGWSDRLAAVDADVVYARDLLARHCDEEGVAYRAWSSLADVLADLVGRGELAAA
ncbi:MAG TPA: haloacid dehalogenase-like hydrolase [Candidatus Limnocylindrales bacterium]